ncbi:MAG: hypothetical protein LBD45_04480, partial [Bacteroidales bacterium]|nr:hypothetical protein [Bacteroidales bacterium]
MKTMKIFAVLIMMLNVAFLHSENDILILDTDFSDWLGTAPVNHANSGTYTIEDGSLYIRGNRYNDTSNKPTIDGAELDPANPDVHYIRTGSTSTLAVYEENNAIEITPTSALVNGGILEITFSSNSAPSNADWCSAAIDGTKIGAINPSTITGAASKKYITGQIVIPGSISGVKK